MHTHRIGKLDIDQPKLHKELEQIAHFELTEIYDKFICGGAPWRSCLLWNIGEDTGNSFATNYDRPLAKRKRVLLKNRPSYAEQLPYLMELIERSFNTKYLNEACLAIMSDIILIPHKDLWLIKDSPSAQHTHRIHVPLITNESSYFSEGNVVYRMRFGEVWSFDAFSLHSAASFSKLDRVHLVLDFADVDDAGDLVNFESEDQTAIPQESICARSRLTEEEQEALLSLAAVIDMDNYTDIFSIVIKMHYRKDGGDNFFWGTLMKIANSSSNKEVISKIKNVSQGYI